jgi:hypothetical protein
MIRLKLRELIFFAIATPVLLLSFNNCAPYDESQMVFSENASLSPEAVALQNKAQEVYRQHACVGCHGTRPGTFGVYLFDTAQLIQNGHLIPGNPGSSGVYVNTGGGHNGVAAFSAGDRAIISDWIVALAPSDPGATPTPTPVATATPAPSGPPPSCTLVASASGNVVPGDAVTITLYWSAPVESGTIDGMNYSLLGKTSQSHQVNPDQTRVYAATVTNAGGTANCSTTVATKAVGALTKDEFYRASVGPNGESVANLVMVGRCQNCHSSSGKTPSSTAIAALMIDPFSASQTLAHLKTATIAGATVNITLSASASNLYKHASSHKTEDPAYNAADLTHIMNYVNHP